MSEGSGPTPHAVLACLVHRGAQYCGIYRCVALLCRPPSHASSLKAGKSQSLVTQLKRSFGDQLCMEASSSPISQPRQRLCGPSWLHFDKCLEHRLHAASTMDMFQKGLAVVQDVLTQEQAASAGDSSPHSPDAPKCQFSRASSW